MGSCPHDINFIAYTKVNALIEVTRLEDEESYALICKDACIPAVFDERACMSGHASQERPSNLVDCQDSVLFCTKETLFDTIKLWGTLV